MHCSLCGAPGSNKRTCPYNEEALNTRLHKVGPGAARVRGIAAADVPDDLIPRVRDHVVIRRALDRGMAQPAGDFVVAAMNVDAGDRLSKVRTNDLLERDLFNLVSNAALDFPDFIVISELPNKSTVKRVVKMLDESGYGGEAHYDYIQAGTTDRSAILWDINRWTMSGVAAEQQRYLEVPFHRKGDDSCKLALWGVHLPLKGRDKRSTAHASLNRAVNAAAFSDYAKVIAGDFNLNHDRIASDIFGSNAYETCIQEKTTMKGRPVDNVIRQAGVVADGRVVRDWDSYTHYPIVAKFM